MFMAANENIGSKPFKDFEEVVNELAKSMAETGRGKAAIDIRDIAFRSDTVSLHRENNMPLRMDGKGMKRLVSIAIQKLLVKKRVGLC